MPRPRRAAVIGAGHYHAAYYPHYFDLLRKHGLEIAGVADPDLAVAEDRARRFGGEAFADFRAMVEHTHPDFVLGLGRHIDMPATVEYLIEAGIPALMEKPWGIDAATVNRLAALAEARGAWLATPLSMRYSLWAQRARDAVRGREFGAVSHIVFRMVRPGVQRYIDQGCTWMLRKAEAGGGVLLNLGIHGFDLCRWITGEEPEVTGAAASNALFGLDVEDYAHVSLRTPSGTVFQVEVGYTYPRAGGNDDERKLSARQALLRGAGDSLEILGVDSIETIAPPAGYVAGWEGVVADCIERLARGEPPPNTPADTARAVSLVFDAYRLAGVI